MSSSPSANNSAEFAETTDQNGSQEAPLRNNTNNSMIDKVRSRVSNILPSSISNWFSPSGKNGNLRRRRDDSDTEEPEFDPETETGRNGGSEIFGIPPVATHANRLDGKPPSKRPKIDDIAKGNYEGIRKTPFVNSTPVAIQGQSDRRHRTLYDSTLEAPYNFSGSVSKRGKRNNNNNVNESSNLRDGDDEVDRGQTFSEHLGRRQLHIGNVASSTADDWLRTNVEHNEDDRASNAEDIDVNSLLVNESASDESISSVLGRKSYSATRDLGDRNTRKVGGLFCSDGGSNKLSRSSTMGGLNFGSHLQGHKSLFPTPSEATSHSFNMLNASTTSLNSLHRRPTSMYGSTSALSDSRLLGGTHSPFYNGRTMFGGASAYSRRASSSQRHLRVPTQIRPSSSLSATSTRSLAAASVSSDQTSVVGGPPSLALSNTAKRILELMNQFTTPLSDVKKMSNATPIPALVAHRKRFGESDMLSNRSVRLNTPATPYTRSVQGADITARRTNTSSILSTELQVPTMSTLLQMKKIMQNNTEKVRELASSSKSVLNKDPQYTLPPLHDSSTTARATESKNKIRTKINSTRPASSHFVDHNEIAEPVYLPNIQLQTDKININLGGDLARPASISSAAQSFSMTATTTHPPTTKSPLQFASSTINKPVSSAVSSSSISATITTKPSTTINGSNQQSFTFSTPIAVNAPRSVQHVQPLNNFKFSNPIQVPSSSTIKQLSSFSPVPQLKSGSVMDIIGKPTEASKQPLPSLSSMFAPKTNQWECDSCMLKNESTKGKCVACESPKPGTAATAPAKLLEPTLQSTPLNTFGTQFKAAANTWECDTCMIVNKAEASKCVACETGRSLAKTTLSVSSLPSLGAQFKAAANTWECDTCMIVNKSDSPKCVACESLRPKTKSSGAVEVKFDSGFQSLVAKQNSKWECSACMTRNDAQRKKCECCELEKPGSASTAESVSASPFGPSKSISLETKSKFSFGVPFNANAPALTTSVASTSTWPALGGDKSTSFSFGVPSTTDSSQKPAFSFGTPAVTLPTDAAATKVETGYIVADVGKPKSEVANSKAPVVALPTNAVNTTSSSSMAFGQFAFGSAATKPVTTTAPNTKSFTFGNTGSSATSISETKPSDGLSIKPVSSGFSFGGSSSVFGSSALKTNARPSEGATVPVIPSFGSVTESSNTPITTVSNSTTTTHLANNTFSTMAFGAVVATVSSTPVTPTVVNTNSTAISFGNPSARESDKPFTFGSASIAAAREPTITTTKSSFFSTPSDTTDTSTANPFVVSNLNKAQPNLGMFGSGNSTLNPTTISSPTFGQPAPTTNFLQTTSKDISKPIFGTTSTEPRPFGGDSFFTTASNPPNTTATPLFGQSTPFMSQTATTQPTQFGAPSGTPSPFGGASSAFTAQSSFAPSAFATPNNDYEPIRKKMTSTLGSDQTNVISQKPAVFSFGATTTPNTNTPEAKTPFNFTATVAPPSFNFSGVQQQSQQPNQQLSSSQPFSFGVVNTIPSAGVFSFGSSSSETSDDRSERKRHSTASKGPSSKTKYSINNSHRVHHPSSNIPFELKPRNRRHQNIAWVRGQHPVATHNPYQLSSINTADSEVESRSIKDINRKHMTPHPTSMSVRPIYNPSVYRINRIKPPNTTSTSLASIDNPSAQESHKSVDSQPPTLGKFKWLSS